MENNLQIMSEALNAGVKRAVNSADEFAKTMNDVRKFVENKEQELSKATDNIRFDCRYLGRWKPKHMLYTQNEIKYPGRCSNQPSITKLAKAFDHPPVIFDEVHEYDPSSMFICKKVEEMYMNNYEKITILAQMARDHEPVIFNGNLVGYITEMTSSQYGEEPMFTIEVIAGPWDQTETIKDVKLEDIRMPYFANHPIPTVIISGGRTNGKTAMLSAGVFKEYRLPEIKNVDYQYKSGLTVVIWEDGTKTFVKCKDEVFFDEEKALAMAIAKKAMGNEYKYFKKIKKFLPEIK